MFIYKSGDGATNLIPASIHESNTVILCKAERLQMSCHVSDERFVVQGVREVALHGEKGGRSGFHGAFLEIE